MFKWLLAISFGMLMQLNASHLIGGAMWYDCVSPGVYRVSLRMYRDCNSLGAPFDQVVTITAFNKPVAGAPWSVHSTADFFLGNSVQLASQINTTCFLSTLNVCTEYTDYVGFMNLPPSASGYLLSHQRCCRNNTISNIPNPDTWGSTFFVEIPGGSNACNNSPRFVANPPVVICAGEAFTFNSSAIEPDGDSLYYRLCDVYNGGSQADPAPAISSTPPFSAIPYLPSFSVLNPITANPPMVLDPISGLLSATPSNFGQFVFAVCVEEYRNGQLLSTLRRDFQLNVSNCQRLVSSRIVSQFLLDTTFCNGTLVQFSQTSIGTNSFLWLFNDPGNIGASSTQPFPLYNFSDTGTFDVMLIANPGSICADTSSARFKLNYPVEPNIGLSGDFCFDSQTIAADALGRFGQNAQFNWLVDGMPFSGSTLNLQPFAQVGKYPVFLEVTDFGCSGSVWDTVRIVERPSVPSRPLGFSSGCAPFRVEFDDGSLDAPGFSHLWDFGDGSQSTNPQPVHIYSNPGIYSVVHKIWSGGLCVDTVISEYEDIIEVLPSPEANLEVDSTYKSVLNAIFSFVSNRANGNVSTVSMGDGNSYSNPNIWQHTYSDTGKYSVILVEENAFGCTDTAKLWIYVLPALRLYIPSAFSPNGDGVNDVYRILATGWNEFECTIYNRWGEMVYYNEGENVFWNGRKRQYGQDCPDGVYFYRLWARTKEGKMETRTGEILLIR